MPMTTPSPFCEEEMGKGAFTGLIHCFTGTQRLADAALELGLYISVSGIATFKNSDDLREVIKTVPLDRLLVETDAPFLAPVPHRGKTNEPAFVVHTAGMLAELKGVSDGRTRRRHDRQFLPPVHQSAARPHDDTLEVHILGCGSSGGVPRLGGADGAGNWGACDPANPKNRRRRCSILVRAQIGSGETRVLVDTSPDMREQLLARAVGAARRRADHPRPCRPAARHRRSARHHPEHRKRASMCGAIAHGWTGVMAQIRLLLRPAAGQRLSADPQRA